MTWETLLFRGMELNSGILCMFKLSDNYWKGIPNENYSASILSDKYNFSGSNCNYSLTRDRWEMALFYLFWLLIERIRILAVTWLKQIETKINSTRYLFGDSTGASIICSLRFVPGSWSVCFQFAWVRYCCWGGTNLFFTGLVSTSRLITEYHQYQSIDSNAQHQLSKRIAQKHLCYGRLKLLVS